MLGTAGGLGRGNRDGSPEMEKSASTSVQVVGAVLMRVSQPWMRGVSEACCCQLVVGAASRSEEL